MAVQRRNVPKHLKNIDGNVVRKTSSTHAESHRVNVWLYSIIAVFLAIVIVYTIVNGSRTHRLVTPLDVEKLVGENVSYLRSWGTYRPGVFFGIKSRIPGSPLVGLMWFTQNGPSRSVRHDANDDVLKYGWTVHDGESFGIQIIEEENFILNISWIKENDASLTAWSCKVSSIQKPTRPATVISFILYIASDNGQSISPVINNGKLVAVEGSNPSLSDFSISFDARGEQNARIRHHHLVAYSPGMHLLSKVVEHYLKEEKSNLRAPFRFLSGNIIAAIRQQANNPDLPQNFIAHQSTCQPPCSVMMNFQLSDLQNPSKYEDTLRERQAKFDRKFEDVFHLKDKMFSDYEIDFAKAAFSNLIGGIGYFFGHSAVQSADFTHPVRYWSVGLLTAVPSRSFFPRGFLWDEGFHQLIIHHWSPGISVDVISHWLDLMNVDGWIPREQILGEEALARVPQEFVVQRNTDANPPALLFAIQSMLKRNLLSNDFLQKLYPRVRVWIQWYNSTQTGSKPLTFRWRGRNASSPFELNPKTLTSGLDDYPRSSHPTDDEYHLDLRCWMALSASVLLDIAKVVGSPIEISEAKEWLTRLASFDSLNDLHWSERLKHYADYGLNSKNTVLVRANRRLNDPNAPPPPLIREVKTSPQYMLIPHLGYVSLFPFLIQLIPPESKQLSATLDILEDENTLRSPFGIRSLSRKDPLYMVRNTEHDPPYWRGQVWLNINYLVLRSLQHYRQIPGPYQSKADHIYHSLRRDLMKNVINQYRSSGYVWEQYSDETGKGKGSHPFTGWSSLIVLIMAEEY